MSDEIREQLEFVEWLKGWGIYNPMDSADKMVKMQRVFVAMNKSRDEEVLQLTSRVAVAEGKNVELEAEIKVLENVIQNKSEENKKLWDRMDYFWDQIICHAGSCSKCIAISKQIVALKDGE